MDSGQRRQQQRRMWKRPRAVVAANRADDGNGSLQSAEDGRGVGEPYDDRRIVVAAGFDDAAGPSDAERPVPQWVAVVRVGGVGRASAARALECRERERRRRRLCSVFLEELWAQFAADSAHLDNAGHRYGEIISRGSVRASNRRRTRNVIPQPGRPGRHGEGGDLCRRAGLAVSPGGRVSHRLLSDDGKLDGPAAPYRFQKGWRNWRGWNGGSVQNSVPRDVGTLRE
mmetsp:Transcript_42332/g.90052  ORF Transcript_42332/g.90052 Transcript_42332/m.90052 type:complete len:228 (+) Transcript_42332:250-933(+)